MSSTTPSATAVIDADPDPTPVGVDVGANTLVAAGPAGGGVDDVLAIDGDHVRESVRTLRWLTEYLQGIPGDTSSAETAVVAAFWRRLRAQLHDAAARVVRAAREHDGAVLVLEDLPYPRRSLWAHRTDGDAGTWILPALQDVLVERATDAGLPVAWVDPRGTSVECHRCGERGERDRSTFRCTTSTCPVGAVDADASAAVTIAKRGGSGR